MFERKATEIQGYRHICRRYDLTRLELTLIPWLRQCLLGVSTIKLLFFSTFPYCAFWKEVIVHSPHLRSRESCSTSLGAHCLQRLFEILLHGAFAAFSLVSCRLVQSLIYINMDTRIFIFYFAL